MIYIGNQPGFDITHDAAYKFDYVGELPAINCNPPRMMMSHLNKLTGELFFCRDNTPGDNVWVGQLGTTVGGA